MSSLKKRNILFYDSGRARKGEGDLREDIPSTDYIKDSFRVKLSAPDLILDPGCGVCSHLLSLDCREKVGLDISFGNLAVAKNRSQEIHLIRGDVENLPLKDNIFDALLVVSLLHHIPDHKQALGEICRVIREGGHLFINDSCLTGLKPIYPLAKAIRYFAALLGSPESFGPEIGELTSVLKKNNLTVMKNKVSLTFVAFLYSALGGLARRLPFIGTKRWGLFKAFFLSLDAEVFSKLGSRFGLCISLVAVKSNRVSIS